MKTGTNYYEDDLDLLIDEEPLLVKAADDDKDDDDDKTIDIDEKKNV
jgi:hypothetical protein